ncbi:MAG: putative LytR family regulatory protein [Ilumatobacteraceae bacterium]|nr:putative LytR family regulatory protein [Ilumatobacteraceae bacterium]
MKLDGAQALALVRSRHTQYLVGTTWTEDPRSDFGRIERQQVFLEILAAKLLGQLGDPTSIDDFVSVAAKSLVVDSGRTSRALVSAAWSLRSIGIGRLTTDTVQATGQIVGGQSVLVPTDAQLADASAFLLASPPADAGQTDTTAAGTTAAGPPAAPTSHSP